uniref:CASPASE_P20 domain-containing protein n=1 Tax=Steinernema glaseri TaxID=37863 RepID=A0A1I7Y8G6_9BILA
MPRSSRLVSGDVFEGCDLDDAFAYCLGFGFDCDVDDYHDGGLRSRRDAAGSWNEQAVTSHVHMLRKLASKTVIILDGCRGLSKTDTEAQCRPK